MASGGPLGTVLQFGDGQRTPVAGFATDLWSPDRTAPELRTIANKHLRVLEDPPKVYRQKGAFIAFPMSTFFIVFFFVFVWFFSNVLSDVFIIVFICNCGCVGMTIHRGVAGEPDAPPRATLFIMWLPQEVYSVCIKDHRYTSEARTYGLFGHMSAKQIEDKI